MYRRELLGVAGGLVLGGLGTWLAQRLMTPQPPVGSHHCDLPPPQVDGSQYTPEAALDRLTTGNHRCVGNRASSRPWSTSPIFVSRDFRPFAAVVSCSDARVDCETLFDERMGDLFVVRQPALLLDAGTIAGLEYAVQHLHVPLILVLGHNSCSALASVLGVARSEATTPPASLEYLYRELNPIVKEVLNQRGETMDNAVQANIRRTVRQLRGVPSFQPLVREKRLLVQGARCDLPSGQVELVDLP
jgi:carbonic anhydrase